MEENAAADGKEKNLSFEWYYADDKPLYYTNPTEKSEARAELLLSMSKGFVLQIQKGLKK